MPTWKTRLMSAAIIATCIPAPTAALANLIANGSFEVPAIADGTLQAITPLAWTGGAALMNPSAAGTFAGNPFLWPQAPEGAQYEDIGNEAKYALSQNFVVADADTYLLLWQDNTALNIAPGFQTAPYSVAIRDSASTVVFTIALDSYHSDGAWVARSVQQFLNVGTYSLTFTSLNQFNRTDTLVDAVSLAVPVPEPATSLLVTIGLSTLLGATKLRRSKLQGT